MDDINGAITFPMLHRYAQLTNKAIPLPDCYCKLKTQSELHFVRLFTCLPV